MKIKLTDKLIFALPLLLLSLQGWAEAPEWQKAAEWTDWVAEPACASLCEGHYEPLQISSNIASEDMLDLPLRLSANESFLALEGTSRLVGEVTLQQGDRNLHADEVSVWRSPTSGDWEEFVGSGHIHYWSPGLNVFAERGTYDNPNSEFKLEDATYHWYDRHARGFAESIRIDCNSMVYLTKADYSTCAPGQNTWRLSARRVKINPDSGRATVKDVRFEFHDMPVFYFPYFNYPVDNKRHSGFLLPSYTTSSSSGLEINIPYYWNIAPNYDMTVAARWMSERGTQAQTNFRYLLPGTSGNFYWEILPDDRKYAHFKHVNQLSPPPGMTLESPQISALNTSSTRQLFKYKNISNLGSHWVFNAEFNYVTDSNYFDDLSNDINLASTIYMPEQANLSYFGHHWTHYLNIEEYQVLQPFTKPVNENIYKRQPQWVFNAIYPNVFYYFTVGLNGEIVNFEHDSSLFVKTTVPHGTEADLSTLFTTTVTTGERYHLRPRLSLPLEDSWYRFVPRAQVDILSYSLTLGKDVAKLPDGSPSIPAHPSRAIPMFDVDGTLIFERLLKICSTSFRQTLEPRAYYLYVPYKNQTDYPDFDSGVILFSYNQLFRDNRFSGRDRVGDADQVSVALTSRLLRDQDAYEYINASIGQIFYFRPRLVSLCEQFGYESNCYLYQDTSSPIATTNHSNLVSQVQAYPYPDISSGAFWELDTSRNTPDKTGTHSRTYQAGFTFQYHPDPQRIINLNYYWLRNDLQQVNPKTGEIIGYLHQADLSVLWPVTLRWSILSRWQYDIIANENVELLGGLEYNGCCVALQFFASVFREGRNLFVPENAKSTYERIIGFQIVFKGLSAIGNSPDGKLGSRIPGYTPLEERQKWLMPGNRTLFPPSEIPLY